MTRDEWSQAHNECMVCGWRTCDTHRIGKFALQTHEIARGSARNAALVRPATWLRVCNVCHEEMGDYSIWPIARQLALKLIKDPGNHNRKLVNLLRGRQSDAISEAEVDAWVEEVTQ